jgi:hypothetical protein
LQVRCSVCGGEFGGDEPQWHAVDGAAVPYIRYTLNRRAEFAQPMLTREVPAHRVCLLYATIACPFLASPNARRRHDAGGLAPGVRAGHRRGEQAALVAYAGYEVQRPAGRRDLVFQLALTTPIALITYRTGAELLTLLEQALADGDEPTGAQPDSFGRDDDAVAAELRRYLAAGAWRAPVRQLTAVAGSPRDVHR